MFRSASPRLDSTAGGPQTYIALFYGNNVTEGTNPGDARLRPMLDMFNTANLFGSGTGGDPLEVLNIEVSRLKVLQ